MKILIAYDGSEGSKCAIEDLRSAGIPSEDVSATILSVAELSILDETPLTTDPHRPLVAYSDARMQEMTSRTRERAQSIAEEGHTRLRELFPKWTVETCVRFTSPATTILEIAEGWEPDLIVMGSHGRSALGRLFVGSVSMRVATEASCPVRIVKRHPRKAAPLILLAFDGSEGSRAAIHSLIHRSWPLGTSLHLVTVAETTHIASLDYMFMLGTNPTLRERENPFEGMLHSVKLEMRKFFDTVTTTLRVGSPTSELLSEADRVKADMIFLGSQGYSKLERLLLGSVSQGIATRARSTVEIVR
jgi:nucleotide-binding universal stress UspA family protein